MQTSLENKDTKGNDSYNGNDLMFAPRTYFGPFIHKEVVINVFPFKTQTYKDKWLFLR